MHGNVFEWVDDCWHHSYENALNDGQAWVDADSGDRNRRVLRGGSWGSSRNLAHSASRYMGRGQSSWDRNFGFRIVRSCPLLRIDH